MVLVAATSEKYKEIIQKRKTSYIYLIVIETAPTLFIRIFSQPPKLSGPFFSTPVSASATPELSSTQTSLLAKICVTRTDDLLLLKSSHRNQVPTGVSASYTEIHPRSVSS